MNNEQIKDLLRSLKRDFPLFAKKNLKIKPKTGMYQAFELNSAQKYIHSCLEGQLNKIGKVRAIIVKGRQQGCSTYVGGRFYWKTSLNFSTSSLIFAHDSEASSALFGMIKSFYEMSEEFLKPELEASNARELLFKELKSGYRIGTAGTKGLGRGKTIQNLHWSEVAYSKDADDHAGGILQAVPDMAGTEIILESTANGQNDYFHRAVMAAMSGDSEYQVIFVPWYWQEEYKKELPEDFRTNKKEQQYLDMFSKDGLTPEHLVWRRNKIKEFQDDEIRFMREYPFSVAEAFAASDEHSYIKADELMEALSSEVISGDAPLIIGVDPAREGRDRIAIAHRRGRNLTKYYRLPKQNLTALTGRIIEEINRYKPARINIDVGGLGIGLYDNLVAAGYGNIVKAVNFGSTKDVVNASRYYNKRAEMYGNFKDWLQDKPCSINNEDKLESAQLQAEITSVGYTWNNNQQLLMQKKEELAVSPDLADAVVLTFAFPVAGSLTYAKTMSEPIYAETGWSVF